MQDPKELHSCVQGLLLWAPPFRLKPEKSAGRESPWPWQVSEGSARGLTLCGAVGPAFSVWSLGGVRTVLPPCSDTQGSPFRPEVCLAISYQYLVGHRAQGVSSAPARNREEEGFAGASQSHMWGCALERSTESNEHGRFHRIFPANTCAAAGMDVPRKSRLGAGFQGNDLHSDLHFLNAQVTWYK